MGKINASDNDTFVIPYGNAEFCLINAEDDEDAIATAAPTTAGTANITIGLADDAGIKYGQKKSLDSAVKRKFRLERRSVPLLGVRMQTYAYDGYVNLQAP